MSRAWIISWHRLTRTSESAAVLNCVSFGPLHYHLVAGCMTSFKVRVDTKECSGKKDQIERKFWLATLSLKGKAQVTGIPVACRAQNCELRGSLLTVLIPSFFLAQSCVCSVFVVTTVCFCMNVPCFQLSSDIFWTAYTVRVGIVPTLQNSAGIGLVGCTVLNTWLSFSACDRINQSC